MSGYDVLWSACLSFVGVGAVTIVYVGVGQWWRRRGYRQKPSPRPPCGASELGRTVGLLCTRPEGHKAPHAARELMSGELYAWPNLEGRK